MAKRRPPATPHVDRDGVRTQVSGVRTGVWLLASAIAVIGVVVFVITRPLIRPPVSQLPEQTAKLAPTSPPRQAAVVAPTPLKPAVAARIETSQAVDAEPPSAPKRPPHPALAPGAAPDYEATPEATPELDSDQPPNEPSGLAVFPPRGTKPIQYGIIVPEDFELPPGYLRHYQTTDDGYQLPPILMFDENYRPVDEHGQPGHLPADRVVPPEMAPPGMPIQMLKPPDSSGSGTTAPAEGEPQVPPPGGIRHRQ